MHQPTPQCLADHTRPPHGRAATDLRRASTAVCILAAIVTSGALAGCSNQRGMTCTEFGAKDGFEHIKIVDAMIREHGLDPNSNVLATVQVRADLYGYCGIPSVVAINQKQSPSTKNLTKTIDSGINWKAYGG